MEIRMAQRSTHIAARLGGLILALWSTTALADLAPFTEGQFDSYTPDAKHGQDIYNAAGCATCHSVEGGMMLLAGGRAFENRLGKVYAPNITHDPKAGIGSWTDAQFLNAVLRGVSPKGETYYGAFFPFPAYSRMKPEDALDMRAYMKTMETSDTPSKPHEVNLFSHQALLLLNSTREPLVVPADPQLARGQYLVEALGHCGECHTPRDGFNLDTANAYTGFMGFFGDYSPDISGPRLEKAGAEAFVIGSLAEGKKLSGRPFASGSMRRVAEQTAKLPLEDRAAIYAYLTGKPLDVASLPQTPVQLVEAAPAVATATDATIAATPAAEVIPAIDPVATGKLTDSVDLMQVVAAACEAPVDEPELEAVATPEPAAPVAEAAPAGVPEAIELAADQVFDKSCRTCHGPGQRNDKTFPMHDIADMALDPSVVVPGDPDKSSVYASIANNRMPLGTKLTPEELGDIKAWIMALGDAEKAKGAAPAKTAAAAPAATPAKPGAKVKVSLPRPDVAIPRFVGGDFTQLMLAAVADLQAMEERDRPYIRYFSFADTALPPVDCTQTGMKSNPMMFLHAALNKFVNSVSRGSRIEKVVPVKGTDGALVRIDMRDYEWTDEDWNALTTGVFTRGAEEAGFTQQSWTDLAVVYPYALDPSSDNLLSVLANGTGTPVPILSASWFTHFAASSPYYDMLLRLPPQIKDLEARMGVDVDRNIQRAEVARAAYGEGSSGVSDHNRMVERHDLPRGGYYWKSYDFAGSAGLQSLLLHPDGPAETPNLPSGTEPFHHDGGEMIFSLDNGMQGYYLSTHLGDRLLVGPTSIVSYRNKPIGKGVEIVNARSCFDCHENGLIRKTDEMRQFIETNNRLTRDQRELLLDMYVPADKMDEYFSQDMQKFTSALELMGITEPSASGMNVSMQAPAYKGGGEIMTYLADLEFDNLDLGQVARMFFLTEDEFRQRMREMGDPALMQTVDLWVQRIENGLYVRRSEIEDVYADLLPRLTDLRPYDHNYAAYQPQPVANYDQQATEALQYEVKKDEAAYVPQPENTLPAYVPPPAKPADPLVLELSVPYVNVKVNDLLEFDVKANRKCELQVLYVEETKTVEELPPEVLGPAFLEPGETRRIPYPGSGFQLRFDTTGQGETMVAFCREGGLGDKRITGQGAVDYAAERYQPLSRGLVIERTQTVAQDNGNSATNAVTFNVSQ
jgi:mono/diheme cytochrome c family protein